MRRKTGRWSCRDSRGQAARRHRADQRHGDRTAGIDGVGIGETFLAIDHDAQFIAGIEPVLLVVGHGWRSGIGGGLNIADRRGRIDRRGVTLLSVGQCIEIALRLHHRDRSGPAHAARESQRGQQAKKDGARASHSVAPPGLA